MVHEVDMRGCRPWKYVMSARVLVAVVICVWIFICFHVRLKQVDSDSKYFIGKEKLLLILHMFLNCFR